MRKLNEFRAKSPFSTFTSLCTQANSTAPAPLPSVCFILDPWVVGGHQSCSNSGLRETETKLGLRCRTLGPLEHPLWSLTCDQDPQIPLRLFTLESPTFVLMGGCCARPLGPPNPLPFPRIEKHLLHHAPPFAFNANVTFKELLSLISTS